MLAFYSYPAEHWTHIRTSNPIESAFSSVRLRTSKVKSCGSRTTTLAMVFKLCQRAEKSWRRLKGFKLLADVLTNVKFINGIKAEPDQQKAS
jgi:putative transposase